MRHGAIGLALLAVLVVACQPAVPVTTATSTPGTPVPGASTPVPASPNATSAPALTVAPKEAKCNTQVTGDLRLANDLTCPGDAFVIHVDNVVLDLNGHTLTGPGMGPQTWPNPQLDSVGVRVRGHTGVTIRHGKTTAFSTGIYFIDMVSSSIESVITLPNRFGFDIHASHKLTVKEP